MEPASDRGAALDCAARSDKGLVRELNEDHHILNPDDALFVVVDGMGGHAAGEIASQIAGDTIDEFVHLAVNEREISWPFGFDLATVRQAAMLSPTMR